MYKLADIKKANKHVHKEKTRNKNKRGVQNLANCFVEFECDQFDSTHTVVTTLHSGEVSSVKLE